MTTQFVRRYDEKIIAGVCGGVGHYLGIDPVLVRLAFVAGVFFGGVSVLLYPLMWLVMPMEPRGHQQVVAGPPHAAAAPPVVHLVADHPRPVEQWKFDPHTGERIQRH